MHGQGQLVGVDNGEQASRERYKAQADGSWIRKAFNGKGVAIVKSTEQAGKFTLTAHSDLLKSNQVTVFTGKKEGQEKTVLGTEVPKVQTIIGEAPEMPTTVPFVYSDGSRAERPVTWSSVDVSKPGIVTVKGMADGREVEARVEVIALKSELPVVKRIAPNTDLNSVDKSVSYVLTDGSVEEYEVDKWEIAEEDKAKLAIPGSRIQATGYLEGQPIHATLVVEEGNPAAPAVPTVTVGGEAVTGLTSQNQCNTALLLMELSCQKSQQVLKMQLLQFFKQAQQTACVRASLFSLKMVALFKPMQFNSLKKRQNCSLELASGKS